MKSIKYAIMASITAVALFGTVIALEGYASAEPKHPSEMTQQERDITYDYLLFFEACYNDGDCYAARSEPIFDNLAECEIARDQIKDELDKMSKDKGGFDPETHAVVGCYGSFVVPAQPVAHERSI